MKRILSFATIVTLAGCGNNPTSENTSTEKSVLTKKYILTYDHEERNTSTDKLEIVKQVDTLKEQNDTTAYLAAVKKWYAKKVEERNTLVLGLYKSFTVVDKNGLDLTIKLSPNVVTGINNQVKSQPEVKKMIDDTNADSLATP